MKLTLKQGCEYLQNLGFKYKGRIIKNRTMRTMMDKNIFEVEKVWVGKNRHINYVTTDELNKLYEESILCNVDKK